MVIREIKWKLVKDTYFFNTTMFYLADDGNYLVYFGKEKQIKTLIDDLNELVRKGCAMWFKLGEYEFGLDKLSKCPTQTWYSIHQTLYSLEPWGVIKESKESARKSLKEGLINIREQIQDYADANDFDITVQTTPKNELTVAFGGTSDTDKIYKALTKELKSRGADLSTVDVKKKDDLVIATWDLDFFNKDMYDDIIINGTIDLIDTLAEVVDLHYVF